MRQSVGERVPFIDQERLPGDETLPGKESLEGMTMTLDLSQDSSQNVNPMLDPSESNQNIKEDLVDASGETDQIPLQSQRAPVADIHEEKERARGSQVVVEGNGKKGNKNQGRRSGDKKSQKIQSPHNLTNEEDRAGGESQGFGENPQPPKARKQKRNLSSEMVDEVTKDLSHLEVQSFEVTRGAYLKRNKETLTIEGSPLVKAKKRDTRPTPVAYREEAEQQDSILEAKNSRQQQHQRQKHGTQKATQSSQDEAQKSRVVQILSCQSQDHDTKDHQENVRRTLLLSGPKGCLRRPEVSPYLQWIDDSRVPPIQFADLLRYASPAPAPSLMLCPKGS